MRVNIYAEEMTDRIEIISKIIDGQEFTGCRFYLYLPASTFKYAVGSQVPKEVSKQTHESEVLQIRGPFIHRPDDDDSAAVTFWGKRDLRPALIQAIDLLDDHYRGSHRVEFPVACGTVKTVGAILEVATERKRQIEVKGFNAAHDDDYAGGELPAAAMVYASSAVTDRRGSATWWPWGDEWYKPTTPRRDLIKAAALIVAEIERIDRIEADVSRETSPDPEDDDHYRDEGGNQH